MLMLGQLVDGAKRQSYSRTQTIIPGKKATLTTCGFEDLPLPVLIFNKATRCKANIHWSIEMWVLQYQMDLMTTKSVASSSSRESLGKPDSLHGTFLQAWSGEWITHGHKTGTYLHSFGPPPLDPYHYSL